MLKTFSLVVALSTLSLGAYAQAPDGTAPTNLPNSAAPIVRSRPGQAVTTEPTRGVWLRSDPNGSTKVLSSSANATEIRVEHGRANVQVYHPAEHAQISVDLPGGKVDLLKDGFYTFNADTNTVRVLRGEAASYTGADAKPIKVKEDHEYAFNGKPSEVPYDEIGSDVLQGSGPGAGGRGEGYGAAYRNGPGYGYGPYGDGYIEYPYPYYAYGYGYPYFGYPSYGFGLGFGYYGGFRGGYGGYGRFGRR